MDSEFQIPDSEGKTKLEHHKDTKELLQSY